MMRYVAALIALAALACGGSDDGAGGSGGAGGLGGFGGAGVSGAGTGGAGTSGAGAGGAGMGGAGAGGMAGAGMMAPRPVTFTSIWDTIIPGCQGPLCHSGTAGGNLQFDTKDHAHMQLMMAAMGMNLPTATNPTHCKDTGLMRVVPGNPDMSLLYAKVRLDMDAPCGSRMPTGGMLPPDDIELIRAWIAAGAMND